ncbi:hypothetical protein GCM10018779_62580 [Streptomyces griseocarneus]|nr:hypothetical protein GCM10018779_62580 [Streptomyces griseocarneus]
MAARRCGLGALPLPHVAVEDVDVLAAEQVRQGPAVFAAGVAVVDARAPGARAALGLVGRGSAGRVAEFEYPQPGGGEAFAVAGGVGQERGQERRLEETDPVLIDQGSDLE